MKYSLLIFVTGILLGLVRVKGIVNRESNIAKLGEFPYMAAIIRSGDFAGGGALISDRHVLTAAHVVNIGDKNISYPDLTVQVGMVNLYDPSTTTIEVDRVSWHPNYRLVPHLQTATNDIAVVTLNKPVTVSALVRPIALPKPMQEYPEGTEFILCGFGNSVYMGSVSDHLKKMTTHSVSQSNCQIGWTYQQIHRNELCALSGACQGDSGSPLTDDRKVLVGIASEIFREVCGSNKPDLYTKVSHFMKYINDEMKLTHKAQNVS